jgi:hypothetical protein
MPETIELRVTLLDNWEETTLHLPPATLVSDLKRAVLGDSKIRGPASAYLVKYKGAELEEASRTLAESGIPDHSALIVMRRRRSPVR